MNHHAIVTKLIGPISPVGRSEADAERLVNLQSMIELVSSLLIDISFVARYKDSHERSVSVIGKKAHNYIQSIKEEY